MAGAGLYLDLFPGRNAIRQGGDLLHSRVRPAEKQQIRGRSSSKAKIFRKDYTGNFYKM